MMTTLALESGYWSSLGRGAGAILLYALIGLALMLIGFQAVDLTTPAVCARWSRRACPMP